MLRILVADDQPDIREALRLLLKGEGFETETVASPAAVLSALEAREFDALLMDLNYARDTTSGQEGLDLLSNIRTKDSTLPIIVMTAWGSLELAVEAALEVLRHQRPLGLVALVDEGEPKGQRRVAEDLHVLGPGGEPHQRQPEPEPRPGAAARRQRPVGQA